ncbi:hypothetical protein K504DRAFT_467233 [Pleomassaria siparia CBS 279.74]|uniref:Uncharacterized protein n=1 Tax=Pleomassaria siparia CBS 279.74 TaxID=1314801 RepID=A0A6G1K8P0_9PLEO|nr:hypothetical protein K504DRAFT_467233 [Pleomassaria siparia CBS 279.74]
MTTGRIFIAASRRSWCVSCFHPWLTTTNCRRGQAKDCTKDRNTRRDMDAKGSRSVGLWFCVVVRKGQCPMWGDGIEMGIEWD